MAQPALRFAYVLARDLGFRTVAQLCTEMSVQEFEYWAVMYRMEGWAPRAQALQHAQLLAVALQGPSTRKGRGPWLASDFLPPDPWAPPPARKVLKAPDVLAYARAANRRTYH